MPNNDGTPKWKQLADDIRKDPLKDTRDVASKWTTVFSGLVGLSTVFGLVQGRDALNKLSSPFQIALLIVFILAVSVSGFALALAISASEGNPGLVPLDKNNFIEWYRNALIKAVTQLQWSRRLGVAAIFLLVVGSLIAWMAPGAPPAGTSVLVAQKSGATLSFTCGTLQKDQAGNLQLVRTGQQPISVNDVISITIVAKCP